MGTLSFKVQRLFCGAVARNVQLNYYYWVDSDVKIAVEEIGIGKHGFKASLAKTINKIIDKSHSIKHLRTFTDEEILKSLQH